MIQLSRKDIISLYKSGGFLAEYAPMNDWWRYLPDYKPIYEQGGSRARMIIPDNPRQMLKDGELELDYGDTFAKMYIYKLSGDMVLRAAGYDPDEIGKRMKTVAEKALAKQLSLFNGGNDEYISYSD